MKNINKSLIAIILTLFTFPNLGYSQDSSTSELQYEVNRVYPFISITRDKLKNAETLKDLNPRYKTDWVKEYVAVEILTKQKSQLKKGIINNETLTQEIKDLINAADFGSDITVRIQYFPANNLKDNKIQEMDFSFTIDPEVEAKYTGGQQLLDQYLKEKVINKIPDNSLKGYDLAAVNFTINEEGEITNAHVFDSGYQPYENSEVEELLLTAIKEMPCWKPAAYANGKATKQDFVLAVGNMKSCVVNLLNIYPAEKWSAE